MGINWASAYEAGLSSSTTVAPAPTAAPAIHAQVVTTTSAAPATTSAAGILSDIGSDIGSDVAALFDGLVGLANDLTEFGQATSGSGSNVGAIGNIGNPQGSNMIKVASTEGQQFTNTFINTSPAPLTVAIWNKAFDGPNGVEANLGSAVAPKTPALTFALAPGASQIVAFQANTQIGFSQAVAATAESGAFATSWGEVNFSPTGSGYDLSAIMNPQGNNYDMAISSKEAECISDMTQNYWYAANNNPEDPQPVGNSDGSCYVYGSSATLTTKMGGTVS